MKLNDTQMQAVNHVSGPALVLSGAGSGKTLVIVRRIINLINCGVRPYNILALTFTNKAAEEMKERVLYAIGDDHGKGLPHLSTFHSFCLKYLRIYGTGMGIANFTIIDAQDQKKVLKKIIQSEKLDKNRASEFYYMISCLKNRGICTEEDAGPFLEECGIYGPEQISKAFVLYQDTLKQQHLLDFDDILLYFYNMLEDAYIHNKLKDRFLYIMVDEYQDTNHIQFLILNRLSCSHRNLFVVGDDDQSIYSFRGACIDNIMDFKSEFPEAVIIKLEKNYRSRNGILVIANSVIQNNSRRMEKKLIATRGPGNRIKLFCGDSPLNEAYKICTHINSLEREGLNKKDIAILYRINAQSREIEDALLRCGINYKVIGNVGFYERKEIKDIIAYLKILNNPYDLVSLKRIINIPPRRIGDKTFSLIEECFNSKNTDLYSILMAENNKNIKLFFRLLNDLLHFRDKGPAISGLVEYILCETGYYKYLKENYEDHESRVENILSFINMCREFEQKHGPTDLKDFIDSLSLVSDQDNLTDVNDTVKLLTVHTAKGLEFPVVFLVGLEEGLFPHKRGLDDPEQLEEERRLFYVAVTRAKDELFLSFAKERYIYGNPNFSTPSRFLLEVAHDEMAFDNSPELCKALGITARPAIKSQPANTGCKFYAGQKIRHKKYGYGLIQSITGPSSRTKITVLFFDINNYKTFLADKFEKFII